ncbi:MAG: hypothetical protein A2W47_00695 [Gammaproteobacteria bacterium RIFCSPHIGHO2_12_38_15]|nr:MAG: hypothetical protein A2W47_00695 [Gammaproteobacteria bacterium RIFCSPHIGHO2_12_38_15]
MTTKCGINTLHSEASSALSGLRPDECSFFSRRKERFHQAEGLYSHCEKNTLPCVFRGNPKLSSYLVTH